MNKIHNALLILPLLAALSIAGCGGGDPLSLAEGGIGGTGISTGTVTGIGSIKVNGVIFNTDNAAIYIEGVRVDDPNLADGTGAFLLGQGFSEGQVVRVVGTFNADGKTGSADAVYYNDSVEGPVEDANQIDATTQELVVMGQTVIVDNQTKPVGINLVPFNSDDLVEVSGLRDDQGRIRAGYIETKGNFIIGDDVEIKGVVVGDNGSSFSINLLTIDYSNAIELPAGGIQNGMQVEVKGTYDGNQVDALTIEQEDDIDGSDDDEVEYEGIVTDTSSYLGQGDSFILGTQLIQTTINTVYKGGLDTDVVVGVRLEAEGYLSGGFLFAEEISFRDAIEIDAPVAGHVAMPGGSPETITITLDLGADTLDVLVNELSKLEGDASDLIELDGLLSNEDYVEVRGRLLSAGLVYAEELKFIDGSSDTDVKLQGPVDSVADPVVTILGVTIDVDADSISEYEGPDDNPIDKTTFFNTVVTGNIVSAEGRIVGDLIDWDKLEIEDEE